jgi:serine/threonine-protein kinase PRP4
LQALVDLLERMLALDPDKRIKPKDALKHPFLKWGAAPKPSKLPTGSSKAKAPAKA